VDGRPPAPRTFHLYVACSLEVHFSRTFRMASIVSCGLDEFQPPSLILRQF
jgi:hypothetical protein